MVRAYSGEYSIEKDFLVVKNNETTAIKANRRFNLAELDYFYVEEEAPYRLYLYF